VSGGGFFAGRRQAEFFEHLAGGSLRERLRDQGADRRVEHGAVGMLDQWQRCHGFEHRDVYFLTFTGSLTVKQRHVVA
jgi:hypothetical protein